MTMPQLSPDELLTTTRAVRKRLDLNRTVPPSLIRECVEIACQAPTGSNSQGWHFVVVDKLETRQQLADLYRQGWNRYLSSPGSLAKTIGTQQENQQEVPHEQQLERVLSSAQYLADHLEQVPVHMIPCVKGRSDQMTGPYANAVHAAVYGSIIPATWNYMLAARSRGLGTAWTSAHLIFEQDAADILGIPYAEFTQVALIPTAYYTGTDFQPALRHSVDDVLHQNHW
jgi:nitroreductase